ncbi:MAG: acyltransferase [Nitrososphaeria archaeon]|jgi:galactoside O-acetyltransferase
MKLLNKEELKQFASVGDNVQIDSSVQFVHPENVSIGSNVRVDAFTIITATHKITIGNYIHIAAFCQLQTSGGEIIIHDFAGISSRCSLFTASDDYVDGFMTGPMVGEQFKKLDKGNIVLHRHAIVGCNFIIMPGITLCEGASVGALSFVNKDVNAYTVVAGVPAKQIALRDREQLQEMEQMFNWYARDSLAYKQEEIYYALE